MSVRKNSGEMEEVKLFASTYSSKSVNHIRDGPSTEDAIAVVITSCNHLSSIIILRPIQRNPNQIDIKPNVLKKNLRRLTILKLADIGVAFPRLLDRSRNLPFPAPTLHTVDGERRLLIGFVDRFLGVLAGFFLLFLLLLFGGLLGEPEDIHAISDSPYDSTQGM